MLYVIMPIIIRSMYAIYNTLLSLKLVYIVYNVYIRLVKHVGRIWPTTFFFAAHDPQIH